MGLYSILSSQECVVLSLFDKNLSEDVKRSVADALLAEPNHRNFLPEKPEFQIPLIERPGISVEQLPSFVGPRSWLCFNLLGTAGAWLNTTVDRWEDDAEYQQMAAVIQDLPVVNDTAERAVKDVEDFANAAHDGEKRGQIILVANSHRYKLPGFLKNEMENNI